MRPGGVPEEKYCGMAMALYNEEESKLFLFDHFIKIVKEYPIFTSITNEFLPPEYDTANDMMATIL